MSSSQSVFRRFTCACHLARCGCLHLGGLAPSICHALVRAKFRGMALPFLTMLSDLFLWLDDDRFTGCSHTHTAVHIHHNSPRGISSECTAPSGTSAAEFLLFKKRYHFFAEATKYYSSTKSGKVNKSHHDSHSISLHVFMLQV